MSFSPSKCSVIRITSGKRKVFHSSYRLHGQELEVVEVSKYLRAKVTSDLTWSGHIANVAGKANRSIRFLRHNFKNCTNDVKTATYTTMVRPVLDYASTVWYPHRQGDIKLWSKSNAEPPDMCAMTIRPAHLDVSQLCWKTVSDLNSFASVNSSFLVPPGIGMNCHETAQKPALWKSSGPVYHA